MIRHHEQLREPVIVGDCALCGLPVAVAADSFLVHVAPLGQVLREALERGVPIKHRPRRFEP